ncbi:MAG: TIGR01906 family membrane protein [Ruminococcaceae bacterium]|nr:TIGR01906 family membrane protein [Oscillospiraceae bacterium]
MRKDSKTLGILLGILFSVFAVALAVFLLLNFDFLYRFDIEKLGIQSSTGYEKDFILDNYHAVTQYLSPFHDGEFKLAGMEFSEGGAVHFEEVKNIINILYLAGFASLFAILTLLVIFKKRVGRNTFFFSSLGTIVLPAILIIGAAIDFDGFFTLFHKLFFNNDLWIFDSKTDPIIKILPQEFFMHCALFIAFVLIFFTIALSVIGLSKKKR